MWFEAELDRLLMDELADFVDDGLGAELLWEDGVEGLGTRTRTSLEHFYWSFLSLAQMSWTWR